MNIINRLQKVQKNKDASFLTHPYNPFYILSNQINPNILSAEQALRHSAYTHKPKP